MCVYCRKCSERQCVYSVVSVVNVRQCVYSVVSVVSVSVCIVS